MRTISFPVLTEFKIVIPTKGLCKALDSIRKAIDRLRRRVCFANVPAGVGALHVVPFRGDLWTAHAHLVVEACDVIDIDGDLDEWEVEVNDQFRNLTNGCGTFSVAPNNLTVGVPMRMARYICKAETCAPAPGSYSLDQLDALLVALHKRHLGIHWGA